MATIIGTTGADDLIGSHHADLVRGWRGEDAIGGLGGDDRLYGGRQRDVVAGGEGSDLLHGGGRGDLLDGGDGDDTLIGWHGPDTLVGGCGVDTALYLGPRDSYRIEEIDGRMRITDLDAGDGLQEGSDWLDGVERAVFGDGTVVDLDGGAGAFDLADLDGTNGFVIGGAAPGGDSGRSVRAAGDVNGDGIADVIIGAPYAAAGGLERAGASYVVFGSADRLDASLDLSALDGSDGFVIYGAAEYDQAGMSVSAAGDLNGDGIDDLVIGAPGAGGRDDVGNLLQAGAAYVVFGSTAGFAASLDLATLDGSNGFVLRDVPHEIFGGEYTGWSVGRAGDINGDGRDDVVIGARFGAELQAAYVVFGSRTGFEPVVELDQLDGSNGFSIGSATEFSFDKIGYSVSSAGDVNGDGLDDLIVGGPWVYHGDTPDGWEAGAAFVIFGREGGFGRALDLHDIDGSNGFVLYGDFPYDHVGFSVDGIGDINGDGLDDVGIAGPGAYDPGSHSGEAYVVFGNRDGYPASLEPPNLDGINGFQVKLTETDSIRYALSVSGAGDVNADGLDDLVIGAPDGSGGGAVYVIFGSADGFAATFDLSSLDGDNGFVMRGGATWTGWSVSGAGDVNADGIDDLIVGAPGASASYVIFGSAAGFAASLDVATLLASGQAATAEDDLW